VSRPIYEPSTQTQIRQNKFQVDQLLRRPGSEGSGEFTGEIVMQWKIVADDVVMAVADGQLFVACSQDLDQLYLVDCAAWISTPSSSGIVTVQFFNDTQNVDMLSTEITIDVGDLHSKDAATPVVINSGNSQVDWGDLIRVDVDVAGTGARGLGVDLFFDIAGT
jgi:hypothetical protein